MAKPRYRVRAASVRSSAGETSGVAHPRQWLTGGLSTGFSGQLSAAYPFTVEQSMRVAAVFSAVVRLSNDIAKTPLRLYRRTANGKGREEVAAHPTISRLSRRPTPYHTRYTFKQQLMISALLYGAAYIWVRPDPARSARAPAFSAFVPIMGNSIRPFYVDGELFYQLQPRTDFERLLFRGVDRLLTPDEIIHIPGMRLNHIEGLALPDVGREAIALSLAMEDHSGALFKNGAKPGGVLEHPGQLDDEGMIRLRSQWDGAYTGAGNSGKTIILEEGMKYHALAMSSEDAQLKEMRTFQIQEVARVFNVPPHKLGDLSNAKYANIEHSELDYLNGSLTPWFDRIEAALNDGLLSDREAQRFFFDFDVRGLIRGDFKSRMEAYALGRNSGFMTANEIRSEMGLNPVPGGDALLQPMNMGQVTPGEVVPPDPADADPASPNMDTDTEPASINGLINGVGYGHA